MNLDNLPIPNVDFLRECAWWDAKASREEMDMGDEEVNRSLRWREIERWLNGVCTILDVGAGTGAFSIPLARRGFQVTHLDLSPRMLELAKAKSLGLANLKFVEGNAADLTAFGDQAFDLVLNTDGAVSFCGTLAERAVLESARVAAKTLIISTSSHSSMIATWVRASLDSHGLLIPAVYEMFDRGLWHQDQYGENPFTAAGCTQAYFGAFKAFAAGEIRRLLESTGMRIHRCGGIGSLSYLCGQDTARKARQDETTWKSFLDICERFDVEVMPEGPGTYQRAGLIAVATRLDAT